MASHFTIAVIAALATATAPAHAAGAAMAQAKASVSITQFAAAPGLDVSWWPVVEELVPAIALGNGTGQVSAQHGFIDETGFWGEASAAGQVVSPPNSQRGGDAYLYSWIPSLLFVSNPTATALPLGFRVNGQVGTYALATGDAAAWVYVWNWINGYCVGCGGDPLVYSLWQEQLYFVGRLAGEPDGPRLYNDFQSDDFSLLMPPNSSFYLSFSTVARALAWAEGVVPEPGAWAMMIAGFGLTGVALRRRRHLTA